MSCEVLSAVFASTDGPSCFRLSPHTHHPSSNGSASAWAINIASLKTHQGCFPYAALAARLTSIFAVGLNLKTQLVGK